MTSQTRLALISERSECRCCIYEKMSSLLVVVSRYWSRPRIFITHHHQLKSRKLRRIDIVHTQTLREREAGRRYESKKILTYVRRRRRRRHTDAYFFIVSFFSPSPFSLPSYSLYLLWSSSSHSFIQLQHIRSSTKINIHLRMDDVAQNSRWFINRNVLSRQQIGSSLSLSLVFVDNGDRILSSLTLFKQATMRIEFDETEYTNAHTCIYIRICQ